MSANYEYPETFDQENPTPELMVLWDEAFKDLEKRRNRNLLWQIPAFVLLWLISFFVFGEQLLPVGIVYLVAFGLAAQGIRPDFIYTTSHDRKSAQIHLSHVWSFKNFFELPFSALAKAKDGCGSLIIAIIALFSLPLWWGILSFLCSFQLFNNLWWLQWFKKWTEDLMKKVGSNEQHQNQHLRGTNILPSVELSGNAPTGAEPPPMPQQALEVLDGLLTLNPDGSIVIAGGASFDRTSCFSGFSINGVTLTRESEELLKASRDGSDHSFRYDGVSWKQI